MLLRVFFRYLKSVAAPSQAGGLPQHAAPRPRGRPLLVCESLEPRYLLDGVPFAIGGDPRVHPEDFRITAFASGLNYPYSMVQLADGSILVGTSRPAGTTYFNSTGELLRLTDADGDGVADGPGTILFTGLPGTVTCVRQAGNLFFVTSVQTGSESIAVLRAGATPADPLSYIDSIRFSFSPDWDHTNYTLAVRDTPGQPGDHDLFFNVGSEYNIDPTTDTVPVSGLLNVTLNGDAIYMVTVHDTGNVPMFSGLTQVATGLRNAAGIALQPGTGDLYFEDNGADALIDGDEPLSTDTLNGIAAADIGTQVFNYGFPTQYVEYRTGRLIGSGAIVPLVAFQPTPDPFNGSESEGPAEIGFAPASFPTGLNNGVFLGFHGRFDFGGLLNEENAVVYYDLSTGAYFHFIESGQAGVGYLDTMLATSDSLFLADLAANGSTLTGAGQGVIYQIQVIPSGPRPAPSAGRSAPGLLVLGSSGALLPDRPDIRVSAVVLVHGGAQDPTTEFPAHVLLPGGEASRGLSRNHRPEPRLDQRLPRWVIVCSKTW
jgi:glucose/arabinose dehydrogenase